MTLDQAFNALNSIVEIRRLVVVKVGKKLSLKVGQEFTCMTCGRSFPVWADVMEGNKIQSPGRCFPREGTGERPIPSTKTINDRVVTTTCEGEEFTVVANGEIYTDFREVKLTDGSNTVTGLLLGAHYPDLSEGDEVTVNGAVGLRWLKDPAAGANFEVQYAIKIAGLSKSRRVKVFTGLTNFAEELARVDPFTKRKLLLQSSFTRIYKEYDLKLAGLLALICRFSGSTCSMLVTGPLCTGKSLFLQCLSDLGKEHVGRYTPGVGLSAEKLWVVDNFHLVKDRKRLVSAMESVSVFATLTTFVNEESRDSDGKKSKTLYVPGLTRCSQLPVDLDRFDLIIFQHKGHEEDDEYQDRILCGDQMEETANTWDLDTLRNFLLSVAFPLQEVSLEGVAVEELIHSFVWSVSRLNMTQMQTQGGGSISARLVESVLKLSKAHSLLLGHRIVTKFDVLSCIMLLLQVKGEESSSEFMDEDVFMKKLEDMNRVYFNYRLS